MSAWRLAGSLVQLRDEVWAIWPGTTVWTIGDQEHRSRYSDHNENADGVVTAIDVVGKEQAQAVFRHILAARDGRTKYAIHDRQIVNSTVSPWVVRDYDGSNPHTSHVHISVGRGRDGRTTRPDLYDSTAPWGLGQNEEDDMLFVVRNGDDGPRVARVQTILREAGQVAGLGELLPEFGADGDYGAETAGAVDKLAPLVGDGFPTSGSTGCDMLLVDWCRSVITADSGGRYIAYGSTVTLS